jgi:hypothetical protein
VRAAFEMTNVVSTKPSAVTFFCTVVAGDRQQLLVIQG